MDIAETIIVFAELRHRVFIDQCDMRRVETEGEHVGLVHQPVDLFFGFDRAGHMGVIGHRHPLVRAIDCQLLTRAGQIGIFVIGRSAPAQPGAAIESHGIRAHEGCIVDLVFQSGGLRAAGRDLDEPAIGRHPQPAQRGPQMIRGAEPVELVRKELDRIPARIPNLGKGRRQVGRRAPVDGAIRESQGMCVRCHPRLYPFCPVIAIPSTNHRCATMYRISIGRIESATAAIITPRS